MAIAESDLRSGARFVVRKRNYAAFKSNDIVIFSHLEKKSETITWHHFRRVSDQLLQIESLDCFDVAEPELEVRIPLSEAQGFVRFTEHRSAFEPMRKIIKAAVDAYEPAEVTEAKAVLAKHGYTVSKKED